MESVEDRIKKAREERQAREKARILKLKEFNLSKYKHEDSKDIKHLSNNSISNKSSTFKIPIAKPKITAATDNGVKRQSIIPIQRNATKNSNSLINMSKKEGINSNNNFNKNNESLKENTDNKIAPNKDHKLILNLMTRRSIIPVKEFKVHETRKSVAPSKDKISSNINVRKSMVPVKEHKPLANGDSNKKSTLERNISNLPKNVVNKKPANKSEPKYFIKQNIAANMVNSNKNISINKVEVNIERKSNIKKLQPQDRTNVFDRLYNNSYAHRKTVVNESEIEKLPPPINKARHTMFNLKQDENDIQKVRRSISAIHLKKMDKNELKNCIHKWPSVGDKLHKLNLTDINEDAKVDHSNISAVKSERKKALKPNKGISFNLNTPTADELQNRLTNWLQKRGKSLKSYQHLQCFGIKHLAPNAKEALTMPFDEENKENIEQIIPDNGSYTDNINDRENDFDEKKWLEENVSKWRNVSCISEADLNTSTDSTNVTINSDEIQGQQQVNELMLGALNDLAELVREGFCWQQCARWLRSIREKFPEAPNSAPYWECRAALEEAQGNFPGSVECWEEAIAKGTKTSMAEASLDQLLDKFMKLEISPTAGRKTKVELKNMVDIKNVFKSTLIRFAVQQAKLKNAETPKYTATPVRRSNRLSVMGSNTKRTPLLQLCTSMRQIDEEFKNSLTFLPNKTLEFTP